MAPWTKYSATATSAKDFLTKQGLSFTSTDLPAGATDNVDHQDRRRELRGWDEKKTAEALKAAGYRRRAADKRKINYPMTMVILVIMMIYVTMVYGPIAAFLVELFPTRIRYTSMSLPYHIGNGWFGGMLPLLATAMVARERRHLLRPVVSDHRGADDLRHRPDLPARQQGSRHRDRLEVTEHKDRTRQDCAHATTGPGTRRGFFFVSGRRTAAGILAAPSAEQLR